MNDEQAEKVLATPFQRTIRGNGRAFHYRFKDAPYEGICTAREILEYHNMRRLNRPRTQHELAIGGGYDYKLHALAGLLLEVKGKGRGATHVEVHRDVVFTWLQSLRGEHYELLEECLDDFFPRVKLQNTERMLRFANACGLAEAASWAARLKPSSDASSPSENSVSPDSTNPESSSGA